MEKQKESFKEYEEKALYILETHKDIYFVCDLANEMGIARSTFYEKGLDKSDIIKNALENNVRKVKRSLRNKWFNNDNPTTQVALYKLLADDDELSRLNNNVDVSLNAKGMKIVVADEKAKEELEDL